MDVAGLGTDFALDLRRNSVSGCRVRKGQQMALSLDPDLHWGADENRSVPGSTYRNTGFPKLKRAAGQRSGGRRAEGRTGSSWCGGGVGSSLTTWSAFTAGFP